MRQELIDIADDIKQRLAASGKHGWAGDELAAIAREVLQSRPCQASDLVELLSTAGYPDVSTSSSVTLQVFDARLAVRMIGVGFQDAGLLLQIGTNAELPWYVRQEAFDCLTKQSFGDLPATVDWDTIVSMVESDDAGELRSAALRMIVSHRYRAALPRLQAIEKTINGDDDWLGRWYDGVREIQMATAALGDHDMIVNVIKRCYDPWTAKRRQAQVTLQGIADDQGGVNGLAILVAVRAGLIDDLSELDDVWAILQTHSSDHVVRWCMENAPDQPGNSVQPLIQQLDNEDWGIRSAAAVKLAACPEDQVDESLWQLVNDWSASRVMRSWAGYTLLLRDKSAVERFDRSSDQATQLWRTPWAFSIDEAVRHAIVHEYAPQSEEGTDIRYKIELAMEANRFQPYPRWQATKDRKRLVAALKAAGAPITKVQDCGDLHKQGGGTYWVADLGSEDDSNRLYFSTIGPFVTLVDVQRFVDKTGSSTAWDFPAGPDELSDSEQRSEMLLCQQVASDNGFLWLQGEVLAETVPGLNVYFFGHREPLEVCDLIYYWQD